MVLFPICSEARASTCSAVSAWQVVERRQKQAAEQWLLITQADHAVLAGDLAARIDHPSFPALSSDVLRAISLHDAGWTRFDGALRTENPNSSAISPRIRDGRPVSFLDTSPVQFLSAWTQSITATEQTSALGASIVSEHFCRLARTRLQSRSDHHEDTVRLENFLRCEMERQGKLLDRQNVPLQRLRLLTDALQFCDLLSLYLCCGADEPVEFPQEIGGATVRVRKRGEVYEFAPTIFGAGASLGVATHRYPFHGPKEVRVLRFLLA
jgi:hypothetical protein